MRTVRAMGRKNTRPWGRALGVLQPASDSRSASWLGPIPRQSRLFSFKGVCLWTSTCVRKQKRGRHNKIKTKKKDWVCDCFCRIVFWFRPHRWKVEKLGLREFSRLICDRTLSFWGLVLFFKRWSPSRSRPGCRRPSACASPGSVPEAACAAAAAGSAGWGGLRMEKEHVTFCV